MKDETKTSYQYNRCSSRGICSINPATASLQEVIISYLKQAAFYELKLKENNSSDKQIENLILNTISILSSNYEISETNFEIINNAFIKELPRIIKILKEKNITFENPEFLLPLNEKLSINEYIRFGEQEFRNRIKILSDDVRIFYKILFILVKSLCINILTAESYNATLTEEPDFILKILNTLNYPNINTTDLKKLIEDSAKLDSNLAEKIGKLQEGFYGKPSCTEVSFSTTKGKAVLVVGSNIRELEMILDKFKNTDIDIFTHDNMIAAHTYPKFREYKNLRGQFGQGMENCLLDFSTFPGPIILTRHSLFNIENLYRGRLFTTDFAYSKGVIPIKNNDFSEVIKSAEESKGFKTGRKCASELTGFNYDDVIGNIEEKFKSGNFTDIFIIGIKSYSNNEEYFNELIKHKHNNILIVSLSCCKNKDNVICLNTNYDNSSILKITNYILKNHEQKISIFIPFCDRHTLSFLINLCFNERCKIYLGEQSNSIINPAVINGLNKTFGIKKISSPKKDMEEILNIK